MLRYRFQYWFWNDQAAECLARIMLEEGQEFPATPEQPGGRYTPKSLLPFPSHPMRASSQSSQAQWSRRIPGGRTSADRSQAGKGQSVLRKMAEAVISARAWLARWLYIELSITTTRKASTHFFLRKKYVRRPLTNSAQERR